MRTKNKYNKGFTLVELLVATAVSLIVIGATYMVYLSQQQGFESVDSHSEKMQSARMTIDQVSRMMRQAGFGVLVGTIITDAKKYEITFRGDVDNDVAGPLAVDATAGATSISIDMNDELDTADLTDLILIQNGSTRELLQVGTLNDGFDLTGEPDTIYLATPLGNAYAAAGSIVRTVETITIAHDYNAREVTINNDVIAENVPNFELHYYNETGTELSPTTGQSLDASNRNNIRRVSMIVDVLPPSGKGAPNRYTMSVELRNMERPNLQSDSVPPNPPSSLIITKSDTCGQFTIQWTAPTQNSDGSDLEDLAGYKVYYSDTSGSYWEPAFPISYESQTEQTVTDRRLADDTTYYVSMISYDSSFNESDLASEVSFTLNDEDPPAAITIANSEAAQGEVNLAWSEPGGVEDVFGYRIYRGTTTGFSPGTLIADENVLSNTDFAYSDTDVQACTTYHYRIVAVDCVNEGEAGEEIYGDGPSPSTDSPLSHVTNTTPPEIPAVSPGIPTGVSSNAANEAVTIFWINPTDADFLGVTVRYSTSNYPISPTDGTSLGDFTGNPGTGMTQVHSGLTNGQTYFYSLFAYDRCGNYSSGVQISETPGGAGPTVEILYPVNNELVTDGGFIYQARAYDLDESTLGSPPSFAADNGKGISQITFYVDPNPSYTSSFPVSEYQVEFCGFGGNTNPCPVGDVVSTWCDGTYSLYVVATDNEGLTAQSPYTEVRIQNGGIYLDETQNQSTTGTYRQVVEFGIKNTAGNAITLKGITVTWDRAYARLYKVDIPSGDTKWTAPTGAPIASGQDINFSLANQPTLSSEGTSTVSLTFQRLHDTLSGGASIGESRIYVTNDSSIFSVGQTLYISNGVTSEEVSVSAVGLNYLDIGTGLVNDWSSGDYVSDAQDINSSPMVSADVQVVFDYELDWLSHECTSEEAELSLAAGPYIHSPLQNLPTADTTCLATPGSLMVENFHAVEVDVTVVDVALQGLSAVVINYALDNGMGSVAPVSGYTTVSMSDSGSNDVWEGTIPYASDTRIWFYITATDNLYQTARLPEGSGAFSYDLVADTGPPACPTGIAAESVAKKTIYLSWDHNTEPDLRGYNVYRNSNCGSYSRVYTLVTDTNSLEPGVQFTDYGPSNNATNNCYGYYITAVDLDDNESTGCSGTTAQAGHCPCP